MAELESLPELIFEVADVLNLRAAGEAGLVDLPTSELTILRLVTVFPGCGVVFLTDRTRMHQANVSATVRSLVGRGLVVKETDERDRRAVRLFPSEQANRDLEALRRTWLRRLTAAFDAAGIAERDRARLVTVLRKTRQHLSDTQSGSAG